MLFLYFDCRPEVMKYLFFTGVLTYEFLVGDAPFQAQSTKETYNKIVSINMIYPEHLKKSAIDLISKVSYNFTILYCSGCISYYTERCTKIG